MPIVKNTSSLTGNTLTIILAGGKGDRLFPLTKERSKPAVPFGGIYRIIDFTLSNCINSGLRRIGLLTQYKSISLNRHIHLGWNIYAEELGEFITCIPPQHRRSENWYLGTADAVYQNIYTINQEAPKRVLILAGDHLYKMDYGFMLGYHYMHEADVTVSCLEVPMRNATRFGVVRIAPDGRILGFIEKPKNPYPYAYQEETCLASMGIYVFDTRVLIQVLEEDAADPSSSHDFGKDILPRIIHTHRVYAYPFGEREKGQDYWRDIGTLDAYFDAHMEIISPDPPLDLFDTEWPLRTYSRPLPPAQLMFHEPASNRDSDEGVFNSMIAPGCIIRGGRIINSFLFSGVEVFPGAVIEDSIIFDDVKVGPGARIRRSIMDKANIVLEGESVGFDKELDKKRFVVTDSGVTVVAKELVK